ncbi:MAG: cell surface protein SprA [Bacteroidaceae bacterium]|nr:cell surface protein SprA [Bacteroidaceae bacterium]
MTSMSTIAAVSNSAVSSSFPVVPADTVKVKKTDYPQGQHPEEFSMDLEDPENLKPDTAVYDVKSGYYKVGTKLGDGFLSQPWMMTPEEYLKWSEAKAFRDYFKVRNDSLFVTKGKDKFDFTNMHFDLGPAEKIFGPGGVQIKTQGSAELKFGYNYKFTDNPSLAERSRTTKSFDFDEKINMSVNAKVGDKMDFNINYNTDATFDFDSKNLKLAYEGKEDEIVKLLEAGNITFPTNSSLIKGSNSLFGIRTDLQFGRLSLQTVVSQKKSKSKTVSSKGGSQMSTFEIQAYNYDENRHFFLAHYFHDTYDRACSTLPNITSGITINRIEVWQTNTGGSTENTRNIIGFVDLAEGSKISNSIWAGSGTTPANASNDLYSTMVGTYADARNVDQTSNILDEFLQGGVDYEKVENARLLSSSEYTLNSHLGYISLKSTLQSNQVLAVAFEYTYNGQTYQVGEFSADQKDNDKALFVKLLKNTSNSPKMGNWDLMMKNVYSLNATSVQKEKFKLDIKYLSDTTGVNLSYIPEEPFKQTTLLKMLNLDRLDDNDKTNPNGKFDFLEGYTIQASTGRVIFPVVEPFGDWLRQKIGDNAMADKYCYDELYDSTKTTAKQIAEKNKFTLTGEYKASGGSIIKVSDGYIPQGSVRVTAGGVDLTEGSDYSIDYASGTVTILNQSIIDAGTNVSVSLESQEDFSMIRKTMMGVNWEYDFSKNFNIGGTLLKVSEKPLTSKVAMGSEPLNNTLWGLHMNWKQNSQWLTNMLDKLPFLHLSAPSSISFTGEYAQLDAGEAKGTQGNASYLDDFEQTKTSLDESSPKEWVLSSTPSHLQYGTLSNDVKYGYNRARLAWYNIDPLFTRRSSSLTPSHIKSDLDQLSNHYVREVYVREVYPNRDTNQGESNTLSILNLAYYPSERGPYNLDPDLDQNGRLNDPKKRWGGMMRKIDTSDFETSNVQYIEFWMLDPFIYTKNDSKFGGDFYINLGDISEDVLKDGKKFYESGMPVSNASTYTETTWGRVPSEKSVVYSFSNESGARQKQDIGLNGLADADERTYGAYTDYLNAVRGKVNEAVFDSIYEDPAGDDYHYFRGSDFDANQTSILDRYKRINSPEGNSPNTSESSESYSTAYKSQPDAEDTNGDYTMNEYENFYEYHVSIRPSDMQVGRNFIVDSRPYTASLRNGEKETVNWYLFRIPVDEFENKVGSISDFSSIRFMRMYMTGFEEPIVLRFANLDLVRGEWRNYTQTLYTGDKPSVSGTLVPSAVNIEENNDKTPVNYVLPPGVTRILDPSQPQLTQENEQALALTVENLATGDARAVYKTMNMDFRHYKHLQMFVHANALEGDTELEDNQMSVFVRMGSDYKSNYYEYEIPLTLTPAGHYDTYTTQGCKAVWPEENMLDIDFDVFTSLKHERNKAKASGSASYTQVFYAYDENRPNNKVSIIGNPSLGEVKTMMIGVRNNGRRTGSVEVWVNELRMQDYSNEGGWAAQGNMNVQLSDLGTVNVSGHVETAGFGGLEEGVNERRNDNLYEWSITTQLELGKFFPEKWKMQLPFYYSYSWQKISPKYNPFDTDMLLKDALDECETDAARDSLSSLTESVVKNKNFSLSNWKSKVQSRKPMPYDPDNFSLSYSYRQRYKTGETTVYENEENWNFNLAYNYSPKYKTWEPFKNLKGKSKWLDIVKAQNLQWLPQNISFNTDLTRSYYEFQERDIDAGTQLPVTFSDQILWNRDLAVRWDIFKALKLSWTSATHAEIEEPYTVVNKNLYPDEYTAWKDSVRRSIASFGRPLTYKSTFTGSYQVPLNKIPLLDWLSADASYTANYDWTRGTELEDGTSLGHTATSHRTVNLNGKINLETLYKKWNFLADADKRFSGTSNKKSNTNTKNASKNAKTPAKDANDKSGKSGKSGEEEEAGNGNKKATDKKTKGFTKEFTLNDSTATEVKHGQNSKRLIVRATTAEGKTYKLKYKKVDANTLSVKNRDSIPVKINVVDKQPLENLTWYKTAQVAARALMMVRNASISYRNTYALTLPGFNTEVGDAFGQKSVNGLLSPGLGFAFGAIGDSYIDKAAQNGWLMQNDSNITTPATTAAMEDLQLKATLEPFRDFKIDLNASRTVNKSKSIQFMYAGMPTTQSGSFSMTVISIGSAFDTGGNINNNYRSKHFEKFLANLPIIQQRLEGQYANTTYPAAAGTEWAGKAYNPENGGVNLYSADVMIPAFLSAYCGGSPLSKPLDIFPTLSRLMPNWSVKYSGLTKLSPWFADHFKSFNINHAYKSIYAVGAYNSYSTFMEYMGNLGFITDVTTGNPIPSSMYNISTVSLNESFSPLLGVDMTFNSGMTAKLEYKKTRTLNLSMTSVALTENFSNDIVVGLGYKLKDINLFGAKGIQNPETKKSKSKSKNSKNATEDTKSTTNSRTNSRTRGVSHDLNLRFEFSYRLQNALNRNIQTAVTTATNGATAYQLKLSGDYTFSRLLTLTGFLDWQKNVPLVSQSSYPTTAADFGISMKFSLTR